MKKLIYRELKEIRKNPDNFNWRKISMYQKLSEEFIREFSDKVDWDWVSYKQKLSEEFILEFYDRINWKCLFNYNKIDKGIFEKMNGEQKLFVVMNYRKEWSKHNGRKKE